ncbi:uncharacterized protein PV06_01259 [Exophiala oligosperma]|uniref:AB hydrolase-1 domain-containing protein n=1 Tax=Exophiala oligosperma TaxID=215243 RepID=A0A0D2CFL3_9EURO|nr:uncharacterized protein PV06_01259 [Exophiala oligosperma]KIW48692.1 hypothetical protein PV06_01259 [Exophiala oligosperma]
MAHRDNDEHSTNAGSRLSATSCMVAISDHSTCVRDSGGEGMPIVLVHALSMDGQMWIEHGIFEALATS